MATSATPTPADATPIDAHDGIADADDAFGTTVTASTREERVIGEYIHPTDLERGDDVFIAYRNRRRAGGLSYSPNGQSLTARVTAVEAGRIRLEWDFTGAEVVIDPDGRRRGWPTLDVDGDAYAVKYCIRREGTTLERATLVRVVEDLREAGVDATYETGHGGGVPRVKAVVEDAEQYEQALQFADTFDALAAEPAFWNDLDAEYERKPSEAVAAHDCVWVTLRLSD